MQKKRSMPKQCVGEIWTSGKSSQCQNKTPHSSGLCFIHRKAKAKENANYN